MTGYFLTDLAIADLREIIDYIALDNVGAASRVLDEFEAAFERLGELPELGHARTDLAAEELRFWPVHSYFIIYRPNLNPIEIARIVSGFRDIPGLLS